MHIVSTQRMPAMCLKTAYPESYKTFAFATMEADRAVLKDIKPRIEQEAARCQCRAPTQS